MASLLARTAAHFCSRGAAISKLVPYLAFFAGIILSIIVIPSALETLEVAWDVESFRETEALVTTRRTQSHQRGPDTVIVEYTFKVDGVEHEGTNLLTRISDTPEDVENIVRREGGKDRLTIWYDPADPGRSVIHGDLAMWRPLAMIALSLLLVLGGAHAYVIDKRRRRLQERADEDRRKKEEERRARRERS